MFFVFVGESAQSPGCLFRSAHSHNLRTYAAVNSDCLWMKPATAAFMSPPPFFIYSRFPRCAEAWKRCHSVWQHGIVIFPKAIVEITVREPCLLQWPTYWYLTRLNTITRHDCNVARLARARSLSHSVPAPPISVCILYPLFSFNTSSTRLNFTKFHTSSALVRQIYVQYMSYNISMLRTLKCCMVGVCLGIK